MACPPGFERGIFLGCSAICPPEFKKTRDIQSSGLAERCVHLTNNARSFPLVSVARTNPSLITSERDRVRREAARLQGLVEEDIRRSRILNDANDAKRPQVGEYQRIQSEYAIYKDVSAAAQDVRKVKDSLRTFRPPTAPASDLEAERKSITEIAKRNLFFIQIALFLVVVVLLNYMLLPIGYANPIAFLLLCVGISLGFFLRRG